MTNIRQSKDYALFMEKLGWKVEQITVNSKQKTIYVFVRQFPLIGSFIKILRIKPPLPFKEIEEIAKKYRAFKVQIEPEELIRHSGESLGYARDKLRDSRIHSSSSGQVRFWTSQNDGNYGYQLSKSPLAPTKTILIDLKPKEEDIFNNFSPEKRRAIRRAIKNEVIVKESNNINEFIDLKNKQLWPFGFLLKNEIKKLWEVFIPNNKAILLLAYKNKINLSLRGENEMNDEAISTKKEIATLPSFARNDTEVLAGVLLLFHEQTAYYWLASSTSEGKTLFAPTILVWEALKLSKKKGCATFDFEGVEDSRFAETKSWSGFSKFKNGFGGKEIAYINPIEKRKHPLFVILNLFQDLLD